jgi:hypothetical protein
MTQSGHRQSCASYDERLHGRKHLPPGGEYAE